MADLSGQPPVSRRVFLRWVGLAGLTVSTTTLLAACGGGAAPVCFDERSCGSHEGPSGGANHRGSGPDRRGGSANHRGGSPHRGSGSPTTAAVAPTTAAAAPTTAAAPTAAAAPTVQPTAAPTLVAQVAEVDVTGIDAGKFPVPPLATNKKLPGRKSSSARSLSPISSPFQKFGPQ